MHKYEIKNGKDVYIYNGETLVQRVLNWDTAEGAEEWAAVMVADLNAELEAADK